MIIRSYDMKREDRDRMRGGEGTVRITHFVEPGTVPHTRFVAEMSLPPGASIGEHRHDSETEYYIILEGSGRVVDSGKAEGVFSGDVVVTGDGGSHSIENTGSGELRIIAFIVNY